MRNQRSGLDRRAAEPVDPWYEGLNEQDRADYDRYCERMYREHLLLPDAPDYDSRGEAEQDDRRTGSERRTRDHCEIHGFYPRPTDDRGCEACVADIVFGRR